MSNPVNQKINPYTQPSMGVNNLSLQNSQLQNLQLQNIDTAKIQQGVNDSPVVKVADQDNPALMAGVFVPSALGVYVGMNEFSKACKGKYEDSLLGKMDKITDKFNNSSLIKNNAVSKLKHFYKSSVSFLDKKVVNRVGILKSIFKTPSVPENKQVLMMAGGIKAELASSASTLFEKYTENGTLLDKVKELGFVKKDGTADLEKYNDVVKNSTKYRTRIMKICERQPVDACIKIEKGGKIPWSKKLFGKEIYLSEKLPFTKKLFCRNIYFSEYANKMRSVRKPGLSKGVIKVIEGLVNAGTGTGGSGGAIAAVMGAWFIADAIVRTINAPKGDGEKRKTFAENMLYNLGFYLTMPISIKAMHGLGGLQYIGMSKAEVQDFRNKLELFNNKAKNGSMTKAEYDAGRKELTKLLKGSTRIDKADKAGTKAMKFAKNIVYRPLKKISAMLMVGLETIHPFRNGVQPKNFAQKAFRAVFKEGGYWSKQGLAYPVRLLAFMIGFAPFFAKFFAKASHVIFGKPQVSVLDGEPETKKEQNSAQPQPMTNQPTQPKVVPPAPVAQPKTSAAAQNAHLQMQPIQQNGASNLNQIAQNTKRENLLDMYKTNASTAKKISTPQEPVRTYVPSTEGVKLVKTKEQEQKDKELNQLLGKAGRAEANANKYL